MLGEDTLVRLIGLFYFIWDDQKQYLAGLHNLMDELDRLTQREAKAKELQSSWISACIADLSVISECLHQLHIYYPCSQFLEHEMEARTDDLKREYDEMTLVSAKLLTIELEGDDFAELGDPSGGKFDYPVEKRRTRENTETMRRAEQNLDNFWSAVDRHLTNRLGKSRHDDIKHLYGPRPRSTADSRIR